MNRIEERRRPEAKVSKTPSNISVCVPLPCRLHAAHQYTGHDNSNASHTVRRVIIHSDGKSRTRNRRYMQRCLFSHVLHNGRGLGTSIYATGTTNTPQNSTLYCPYPLFPYVAVGCLVLPVFQDHHALVVVVKWYAIR